MPHTLTFRTPVPPSLTPRAVILATQDHASMLQQNPLLVTFTKHTSPPSSPKIPSDEQQQYTWYKVTERVQLVPGISFAARNVQFDAGFLDVEDGMRTHVLAPMGVELRSYWRVAEGQGGSLVLEEETVLTCNALLTSVCKKNINEGHSRVAENVLANAAAKMGEGGTV